LLCLNTDYSTPWYRHPYISAH